MSVAPAAPAPLPPSSSLISSPTVTVPGLAWLLGMLVFALLSLCLSVFAQFPQGFQEHALARRRRQARTRQGSQGRSAFACLFSLLLPTNKTTRCSLDGGVWVGGCAVSSDGKTGLIVSLSLSLPPLSLSHPDQLHENEASLSSPPFTAYPPPCPTLSSSQCALTASRVVIASVILSMPARPTRANQHHDARSRGGGGGEGSFLMSPCEACDLQVSSACGGGDWCNQGQTGLEARKERVQHTMTRPVP
ncbi:hypothetical protein B0O80DRAFT_54286 [Mortierella sp. GBAus27b]|nr:hypothetical protein B0O80DRAFT_54286 [Mortierella sp. GBAus27b]